MKEDITINKLKKSFSKKDIDEMEQRYRAAFINSLSGFKSGNLIGTIDLENKSNQTNLAIFSSCFHLGASPALLGLVSRPDITARHTLENIIKNEVYTINHVNTQIFHKAHQTSARYPKSTCEFKATGLTPEYIDNFEAPFVRESNLKIGMRLKDIVHIKMNETKIIIGEINNIIINYNDSLPIDQNSGHINIEKLDSIAISGLDHYHSTKSLARLSYAKPGLTPKILK